MARVDLGYFENFKSADTLLIEGDSEGLQHLAAVLRSIEAGSVNTVAIDALPFVETHRDVRLTAVCASRDSATRSGSAPNEFRWERTQLGWRDAVEKIEVLIGCPDGHQYLESAGDRVVVQVSKGEYGAEWWSRHG